MKVTMDDGTEVEGKPGDTAIILLGHDAWMVEIIMYNKSVNYP